MCAHLCACDGASQILLLVYVEVSKARPSMLATSIDVNTVHSEERTISFSGYVCVHWESLHTDTVQQVSGDNNSGAPYHEHSTEVESSDESEQRSLAPICQLVFLECGSQFSVMTGKS